MVVEDIELLERWRSGDSRAGNTLVRRHFRTVYCFFRSKVELLADDLTQRTFLVCVESRDRFRGESTFRAYLLGIARRILLRYFRDQGYERRQLDQLGEASVADLAASPSTILAEQDTYRTLLTALQRLPLDLQIALELYYWERLSQPDIGAVLGIPEGTVKSRLNRARTLLKQTLAELSGPNDASASPEDLAAWVQGLQARLSPGDDAEA